METDRDTKRVAHRDRMKKKRDRQSKTERQTERGKYKLAVTCDFQQCGILTSVDSDKPVQPPFKP